MRNVVEFLGKHSGNMYFVHSFFYYLDFKNILFGLKYPVLIYLMLVFESLMTSVAFEKVKGYRHKKGMHQWGIRVVGFFACILFIWGITRVSAHLPKVVPVYLQYETGEDESFYVENLTAQPIQGKKILIKWTANTCAEGYLVYRKAGDGNFAYIGSSASEEYIDNNPSAEQYNFYRIYPFSYKEKIRGYSNQYTYVMPR